MEIEKYIKKWKNYYDKRLELRNGNEKKVILDGPPYMNSFPHMGHALTRVYRDALLKYLFLKGYKTYFRCGFDTHGLPIENAVEKKLGLKNKQEIIEKYGAEKFNKICFETTLKNREIWTEFYEQFGLQPSMDIYNPYITCEKEYIEKGWEVLKKAYNLGKLYKGKGICWWCPHCQTALSESEVEYEDTVDLSIYVKFPIKGKEKEYFVIWTTTPWTLPANMAICVNPKYQYAKVNVSGEIWIIARELVKTLMEKLKIDNYEIIDIIEGKDLEKMEYEHILKEEYDKHKEWNHFIILGNHVSLESGTGLVHTAPAHGQDDYNVGLNYNLEIYTPVNEEGKYIEGKFKGKCVFEVNEEIIKHLEEKGYIVYKEKIKHRYPVCWRCKTKLISLAVEEWMLKIPKEKLLEFGEKVNWYPPYYKKRFIDWVEQARDWILSRKRFWGIPIPIWICKKCGNIEVIGSFKELKEKATKEVSDDLDLHRPYVDEIKLKCQNCNGEMERVPEIADVWFDSAIAFYASYQGYKDIEDVSLVLPYEFITEGVDQINKWFYYSMFCAAMLDYDLPFKNIIINEFVLDEKGKKMSKSKGNGVDPRDEIKKFGPDPVRWYLLADSAPWTSIKYSEKNLKIYQRALITYKNIVTLFKKNVKLNGLDDYDFEYEQLNYEDKWILSRLERMKEKVDQELGKYNTHIAAREIRDFIVNEVSRDYIQIIRDRLKNKDTIPLKVIYKIIKDTTILLSIYCPFISEEIYEEMNFGESVHLENYPEYGERNIKLEKDFEKLFEIIETINNLRNNAKINLRQPLRKVIISTKYNIGYLENIIRKLCNLKEVIFSNKAPIGNYEIYNDNETCIYLDIEIDEELKKEGLTREIIRRIQVMRKELKLFETDKILCSIKGIENIDYNKIEKETNISKFTELEDGLKKEFKINEDNVEIKIKKEE